MLQYIGIHLEIILYNTISTFLYMDIFNKLLNYIIFKYT